MAGAADGMQWRMVQWGLWHYGTMGVQYLWDSVSVVKSVSIISTSWLMVIGCILHWVAGMSVCG